MSEQGDLDGPELISSGPRIRAQDRAEPSDSLTADEIKALLWATAPYSDLIEVHESSVVGDSVALIRSARAKLERQRP